MWFLVTVRKQAVKYTLVRLVKETELPFVHFLSWPCTPWYNTRKKLSKYRRNQAVTEDPGPLAY